jgi:hypothetical protein
MGGSACGGLDLLENVALDAGIEEGFHQERRQSLVILDQGNSVHGHPRGILARAASRGAFMGRFDSS